MFNAQLSILHDTLSVVSTSRTKKYFFGNDFTSRDDFFNNLFYTVVKLASADKEDGVVASRNGRHYSVDDYQLPNGLHKIIEVGRVWFITNQSRLTNPVIEISKQYLSSNAESQYLVLAPFEIVEFFNMFNEAQTDNRKVMLVNAGETAPVTLEQVDTLVLGDNSFLFGGSKQLELASSLFEFEAHVEFKGLVRRVISDVDPRTLGYAVLGVNDPMNPTHGNSKEVE